MEPFGPTQAFEIACGILWLGLLVTCLTSTAFAARRLATRKLRQALRASLFALWTGSAGVLVGLSATVAAIGPNQTPNDLISESAFVLLTGAATILAYFVRSRTLRKMKAEASPDPRSAGQPEIGQSTEGSPPPPVTVPQKPIGSFSKKTARASLWCLAVTGMVLVLGVIDTKYDLAPTWLEWIICGLGLAAVAGGFILGLIALILPKGTPRRVILAMALPGCLGNVLCLLPIIAWASAEHDYEMEIAREKFASEVETRYRTTTADLGVFQKRMQRVAQNRQGEEAIAARVYANIFEKQKKVLENYYNASKPLQAGHLLTMTEVENQAEITRRKNLVQAMVSASKDMDEFFFNLESNARSELLDKGVSPTTAEKAAKAFREGLGQAIGRYTQVSDLRMRWAQDEMAGLDMLHTNWGKWACNAETGKVEFQDKSQGVELDRLIREINDTKRAMEKIQQKVLEQK